MIARRREPDALDTLTRQLNDYLDPEQVDVVRRAYELGASAHEGQTRRSGEAYIHHPVAVAQILADLRMDHECLAGAILHDTIEDTETTYNSLSEQFGPAVADLVDGVTKLDRMKFRTREEATAESFRKMLLAMSRDLRVLFIKLADRLHNMRTLGAMSNEARARIARETLEIYAPLAERLGLHHIRNELDELSFKHLHPYRYRIIAGRARRRAGNRQGYVRSIRRQIQQAMDKAGIECRVHGRRKSPYSIYRKMLDKRLSFQEVMDVHAFRIVTQSHSACYQALGVAHQLFKPKPGRFKDYIALPKSNGYQSLHTVLSAPDNSPIEIQIRTEEMDVAAEYGQAAHWAYKYAEGGDDRNRATGWLSRLIETHHHAADSREFIEGLKPDLFPDEIFVFTPKGRIIDLKRGATALDFAYAIHTDIGNQACSAEVDHANVPLRHGLSSGETVEIHTREDATPRPEWLSFAVTNKARTAIRHYLKNMEQGERTRLGHRLLDQALAARGSSLESVPERRLQRYLRRHNLDSLDELFTKLAEGEMLAEIAAARLQPLMQRGDRRSGSDAGEALRISGGEGSAMSFAHCCYPIPGDRVMGYVSAGKGVVIHREDCPNVRALRNHPERCLDVAWDPVTQSQFTTLLRVITVNRPGVLASVSTTISRADSNIQQVEQPGAESDAATLMFWISVRNREHLAAILRRLRHNSDVLRVNREMA